MISRPSEMRSMHLYIELILCCANPQKHALEVADGDNKVKPI